MRITEIRLLLPTLAACALSAVLVQPARAQGSGSSRLGQPGAAPAPAPSRQPYQAQPTPEAFYKTLWGYLVRPAAPYTAWPPLPGKEGLRKGQSPHGAFVRLYANPVARADPKALPAGSILILEDYTPDQKARTGINILYRVKGYDPQNNDWYWLKFFENGAVATAPPQEGGKPLAGRVQACIDCHRKAGGNDFVFSNDPAPPPAAKPEEKPEEKKAEDQPTGKDAPVKPNAPRALLGRDWAGPERVALGAIDQRPWDDLLKRYVDPRGLVAYGAWRAAPADVRALERYLDDASRGDPERLASRAERLAFWLNVYNAMTVYGILVDVPATGDAERQERRLRVGSREYTSGQIEHEVLRPLGEPRVHFALVCGARGCPRLLNEGYQTAALEDQLTRNSLAFFADPTKFSRDPAGERFSLSAILEWYAEDFGGTQAERLRTIAPYLPDEASRRLAGDGRATIDYLDYDQGLNERPTPPATSEP